MRKLIIKILRKIDRKIFNRKKVEISDSQKENFKGVIVIGDKENVSVGDFVSFGGNVVLHANAPIVIGEQTMIGINTVIHTSTHNYNNHPMWLHRVDSPIYIGKHVWIGASAVILAGVKIEDYAVIGAGTIVTANVPKAAIVVGNPARILKFREIDNIENHEVDVKKYPGKAIFKDMKSTVVKKIV